MVRFSHCCRITRSWNIETTRKRWRETLLGELDGIHLAQESRELTVLLEELDILLVNLDILRDFKVGDHNLGDLDLLLALVVLLSNGLYDISSA